jgi:hypothetical protein
VRFTAERARRSLTRPRLPLHRLPHTALRAHPAALVGLYEEPERPPNAVDYVKRVLGAAVGIDVDALKAENEQLKAQVSALQEKVTVLTANQR